MRILTAMLLLGVSAGVAVAGDEPAKVDQTALTPAVQQSVPQQPTTDTSAIEQSFYGFSGDCGHKAVKEDTAKLLMN